MKIVISPAKSLNWDCKVPESIALSEPIFLSEAVKVNAALKRYSKKNLAQLQSTSPALAELNFVRNQNWLANNEGTDQKPAAFAFSGEVYRGLGIEDWGSLQADATQNSLRILSGLYGVLKPFDLISPYRLEMGTKLKIRQADNLYKFWQDKIAKVLRDEMSEGERLINLASQEYFKAINNKVLMRPVTEIIFKDRADSGFKVKSFYAKKARGLMARFIIENNITDLKGVMSFDKEGYFADAENSTEEKIIFLNERNN